MSTEDLVAGPAMLILIAIGVRFIIHGGLTLGRTDLDEYNRKAGEFLTPEEIEATGLPEEQQRRMMAARRSDNRVGAICMAIMMVATIVGLVMLFVPGYENDNFWLAWPIGGLCCGIVAVLIKAFGKGGE